MSAARHKKKNSRGRDNGTARRSRLPAASRRRIIDRTAVDRWPLPSIDNLFMTLQTGLPNYASGVQAGAWFQSIQDEEFKAALLTLGRKRLLHTGQRLFARGDAPDGLYCVVTGTMRIANTSDHGKEALLAMMEPPFWFGEIGLIDGLTRTHDAVAEVRTELHHLPQQIMLDLLARRPQCWRDIAKLMTHKMRSAFVALEDTALLTASGRLASRLVSIAEGYGEWTDRSHRHIQIPQDQLARMLALSRQTVNQNLKHFESLGIIAINRGGVEILNLKRLRALSSCRAEGYLQPSIVDSNL